MSQVKWSIDPNHSEVTFKVKHLMISTVTGQFNKFNLDVVTEGEDFTTAKEILLPPTSTPSTPIAINATHT